MRQHNGGLMNYQSLVQEKLEISAKSHWRSYNKRRLDYANGCMPETNPVSFYFFAATSLDSNGEIVFTCRFARADTVGNDDIAFYDGCVIGDSNGNPIVNWHAQTLGSADKDPSEVQTPVEITSKIVAQHLV